MNPELVDVSYDLHGLPTAQHKAGLTGLLLQIESMNERRKYGSDLPAPPEVLEQDSTHAIIRFTAESTKALFDDLYAATLEEVLVRSKWSGKDPKRIEEIAMPDARGRSVTEKRFVYEVERPSGAFLARYTDGGKEAWHKLWRDMLWAIPRGKPTARAPFKARAAGEPTKEGAYFWDALLADQKARRRGKRKTVDLSSTIFLGAQAVNAENVRFDDFVDNALLLHFWPLIARIYVPEQIDSDGNRQFVGYVLAIPEVSDLREFQVGYTQTLVLLDSEVWRGRPRNAVIALPEQGALEFMRNLADLVEQREFHSTPSEYLSGIQFYHMIKAGNNIKSLSSGHVPPRMPILDQYRQLRSLYHNPLMLAGRLRALLSNKPWFAELRDDLLTRDWWFFVHATDRTPRGMLSFAYEAAQCFEEQRRRLKSLEGKRMNQTNAVLASTPESAMLDRVVYRLVGQYVREKALARLRLSSSDPMLREKTHDIRTGRERPEYQEARREVASQLFLALRSRQAEDFVKHFTAALGSVAQFLPEADYALLSAALMRSYTTEVGEVRPRTRDDVKTLTLLALSAHSRSLLARNDGDDAMNPISPEES